MGSQAMRIYLSSSLWNHGAQQLLFEDDISLIIPANPAEETQVMA